MADPSKKRDGKYTYGDYLKWSDDERWELIDGVPYSMSPAPSRHHQEICMELSRQFANYLLHKSCRVYPAPFEVRFPSSVVNDEDIQTVVQPDIAIVCDQNKLDDRGCKGAPDLIVEILSPSTTRKDLYEKYNLYERNGVREYWVVFPPEQVIDVYQLNASLVYEKTGTYYANDKVQVGIFEDLSLDLTLVFTSSVL